MSKSNFLENAFLELILKGTAIAGLARDAAVPLTSLYFALHLADPGEGGNQTTSEATYTGYARVAVARPAGFTVTGNVVNPAATIVFPIGTGGSGLITHWSLGVAETGAGNILWRGTYLPNRASGAGAQPKLTTATSITEL